MRFIQRIPEGFKKDKNSLYLAVVGGRTVDDKDFVEEQIDRVLENIKPDKVVIVSGGAKGVDTIARQIAEERGYEIVEIIPDWETYGKKAGPMKNKEIVDLADMVLAIPSKESRGTIHTINYARSKRKPLFVFPYREYEVKQRWRP